MPTAAAPRSTKSLSVRTLRLSRNVSTNSIALAEEAGYVFIALGNPTYPRNLPR